MTELTVTARGAETPVHGVPAVAVHEENGNEIAVIAFPGDEQVEIKGDIDGIAALGNACTLAWGRAITARNNRRRT